MAALFLASGKLLAPDWRRRHAAPAPTKVDFFEFGKNCQLFVRNLLTEITLRGVSFPAMTILSGEMKMNDLIVYAGIGILLIGLPVLFARWNAKH